MYGYSAYGTNEYGASRPSAGLGPAVMLAMRVLQSGYGIMNALMLRFRNTTLSNPAANSNNTLKL